MDTNEILTPDLMMPGDPIYNKLSQSEIDKIYLEKYLIAKLLQPRTMIEVGVRTGYSAIAFFKACPDLIYYGFDSCDKRQAGNKKYIQHAKKILKPYTFVLKEFDTFNIGTFGIDNVDLVSIDGNHTYEYTMHDLELAYKAVKNGGFILIDDISYIKSVRLAVGTFLESREDNLQRIRLEGKRGFDLIQVWRNK